VLPLTRHERAMIISEIVLGYGLEAHYRIPTIPTTKPKEGDAYTPPWSAWTSYRTPRCGVWADPVHFFAILCSVFFSNLSIIKCERISKF
jgi:hypothetical protein